MKFDKHIVLLVPGFADGEADDVCIPPLQIMLREFIANRPEFQFTIIAFQYPYRNEMYYWNGIPVYPCDGSNRKSFFRLITWRRVKKIFRKIHAAKKVSLIHSFWLTECAKIGNELSEEFQIPHLNSLMGQDVLPENKYLPRFSQRRFPVVALCDRHSETLRNTTGRAADYVIEPGMETIYDGETERDIDVLVWCWLHPLKRVDMALRAAAELKNDFPDLKMVISGGGELYDELIDLADSLGLKGAVKFTGQIKRKDTLELMKRSKVFLHTSSYEGFGFVFAEALELRVPVVSFPVGVAKASANWKLVNEEYELAPAIRSFLKQPPQGEFVRLSVSDTVTAYANLYAKLIGNRDLGALKNELVL